MLTLPEIHGLIVHLPVLAVPVVAVLGFLRWKERGGAPVAAAEPWAFAVAIAGTARAVVSGLTVFQGARTTLRGHAGRLAFVHLGLGLLLLLVLAAVGYVRWRRRAGGTYLARTVALTGAASILLVVAIGYVGGRMVYIHGTGVRQGGEFAQTAQGVEQLAVGLARGASPVALGRTAFRTGLGCGSCHGMNAEGGVGPCVSGGIDLGRFRDTHGDGLFPRSLVSDRMLETVNAWLRTKPANGAVCHGDG